MCTCVYICTCTSARCVVKDRLLCKKTISPPYTLPNIHLAGDVISARPHQVPDVLANSGSTTWRSRDLLPTPPIISSVNLVSLVKENEHSTTQTCLTIFLLLFRVHLLVLKTKSTCTKKSDRWSFWITKDKSHLKCFLLWWHEHKFGNIFLNYLIKLC